MKLRQWVLLIFGISLFTYLIAEVGWQQIINEIFKLQWKILPLILIYALVYSFDTLGWSFGFKPQTHQASFINLFWIRVAGEAVNNTTPTGYMGGEPVKAFLLKRHGISIPESLASLVIAKTTLTLSQILFVLIGLGLAFIKLQISSALRNGIIVGLGLLTLIVLLFLFFQGKGLFSAMARGLIRLKIATKFLMSKMDKIKELEFHISDFYRKCKGRFLLSFLFHFLGWLAGILEIYFILKFLGIPLVFSDAFMIEALHQLVRGLAFMIPANIGTQEGGNVFIFALFGLGAVLGLSVSLIRRIRELVWAGLGWGILLKSEKQSYPNPNPKGLRTPEGL
jgi:putative membrane protein